MPLTCEQYQRSLREPALYEQLKIRDLVDNVAIQTNGSFVAGYELSGLHGTYGSDEERNRAKGLLEALVRSLPERSMRMQMRFEITEGTGDLLTSYNAQQRNPSGVLQAIDRVRAEAWRAREAGGYFLRNFLHAYFIWDPRVHHQPSGFEWKRKMKGGGGGGWNP
jgi:hypothetical protein